MAQHAQLAAGRWATLSLAEQMGNIGSEVGRATRWLVRGNDVLAEQAFVRGLELFDLTLADDRWKGRRRREIARAREAFCGDFLVADSVALSSLERYFGHFALLARRGR